MAIFKEALKIVIENEGGYTLHKVSGDRGGLTFAGISYNAHPKWDGWSFLEDNDIYDSIVKKSVHDFYRDEFWNKVKGSRIKNQKIANVIFDCAVNMGQHIAIKLAQIVLKVHIDGLIGPITIGALNSDELHCFTYKYAIARISAYNDISSRDKSQLKFLNGWINRALRMV